MLREAAAQSPVTGVIDKAGARRRRGFTKLCRNRQAGVIEGP